VILIERIREVRAAARRKIAVSMLFPNISQIILDKISILDKGKRAGAAIRGSGLVNRESP